MTPFLRWPGSKRWFISNYSHLLPIAFNRYVEPFLGSGAVFFHFKPNQAILSDVNRELVAAYQAIRDDWAAVCGTLNVHQLRHDKAYYYAVRQSEPRDVVAKAARLIYLNRTCFNGIYRVNLDGKFNVPKGTKTAVILKTDDFEGMAKLLATADVRVEDFEPVIDGTQQDDFVFADPPYTVRHNVNGFIRYNEELFSWDDQVRLADALTRAKDRGVRVVATNANHKAIRELYRDRGFSLRKVLRYSSISADSNRRKTFDELVISAN